MARLRLKSPLPVKEYEAGKTKIFVYSTDAEAAYASAINVLINQAETVDKKGTASVMLMAAPSAYKFYKYYFNILKSSKILQHAVKNTHYFQMDEYILPEEHPASFKYLLKHNLFDYLDGFLSKEKIHYFYIDINNVEKSCTEYIELIIEKGLDIQVKGQGEDGHWGYHQPGTPFGNEPSIIEVKLNNMNISQQLRDHPDLFKSINDPPRVAYSGNVALFMETENLIEDIVPQQSKAYAVVASYGNEKIDPVCPSGKLKEHKNSIARINPDSSWALEEYRQKGYLSMESIHRLDKIWESSGDIEDIFFKKDFMRKSFQSLGIKYEFGPL
jgi:glucosamine-6-phosphate deaminase